MKNQKTWVAVILLGTVAVNAGAYLMVRSRKAARPEPVATRLPTPPPVETPPPSAPPPSEDANAGVVRALRASGLAALEDRDYERAVAQFTEALKLRPDDKDSDLTRLLGIATDLRSREQSKTAQAPTPRESTHSRATPRTRAAKLAAARAAREPQATPAAAQEEARGGLLLVTSTPPGLVVMVDGRAVDLTPARLPVSAGAHRVVLAQGDRRLYEETVEVDPDSVRSLNRDLSEELTPSSPKPAVAPVAAVTPASPPADVPAAAPRDPEPAKPPEPSVAKAAVAQRGDLEVTSPGLYGEVWINGRPYGFPPISAQALPSGPAKVEVRVNGEVKRRMTVEVEPGRSTRVRVK
ncbi:MULTISPECIES: PEGA domain-containing protein [unclassified Corallococcus]|uniref:PEGA domain-containing protein n=1 Tax=unclassified Corallococcus TaxID=2685029 RepID=UPI001A8D274E|nr:PEGA domain-containing protein [Corallococcus sp. NCRR]MBN9683571.1 PEGA domain-containing protein [Corallococcus sp. NCSPR001]WAS84917.1 PEGA domain-containing protein [Corallococcus sp. NCRR]